MAPDFSRRAALGGLGGAGLLLSAGPSAAADRSVDIPFRVTRNQPWVAVTVNGGDPMAFLIDTGSNIFGISLAAAKANKLNRLGKSQIQAVVGRSNIDFYEARELTLGGGAVRERSPVLAAIVADDSDLISGILPVAKWAITGLNFDTQQMTIATKLESGGAPEGFETLETITQGDGSSSTNILGNNAINPVHFEGLDQRPVIQAEFDGRPVRLLIDTGATSMLYLFPDFVQREDLWDHYPEHLDSGYVGILGSAISRTVRGKKLKIGRYGFERPLVELANPADGNRDGVQPIDGLIGMELIRRLNFLYHPVRRRFYFRPSKAIHDIYRFNRSGMNADLEDGLIKVVWIDPDGAAARAGLVAGDHITGWRGTDGFYGMMWALRGPAGSKVEIQIERDGATTMKVVVLEDLI
jgi:predicted aspartyl protease